jgi:hypothetical protein
MKRFAFHNIYGDYIEVLADSMNQAFKKADRILAAFGFNFDIFPIQQQ